MTDETEGLADGETTPEGADDGRPDWLPPNFTTPEALAESYRHAQTKISEQGSRVHELEEQLAEQGARLDEVVQAQSQSRATSQEEQILDAMTRAWEEGDVRAFTGLQLHLTNLQTQNQLSQLQQQNSQPGPDPAIDAAATLAEQQMIQTVGQEAWDEARPEVLAKLQQFSLVTPEKARTVAGIQEGLEAAYAMTQAPKLFAAQQKASQAEAASRDAKLAAQTATGGGNSRPAAPNEAQDTWAKIVAAGSNTFGSMIEQARNQGR